MSEKRNWRDIVAKADHYKAIGWTSIYLHEYTGDDPELPWEKVHKFSPSGSFRSGLTVSGTFYATISGLELHWNYELEHSSANGRDGYYVDTDKAIRVLGYLTDRGSFTVACQFEDYLRAAAEKIEERARGATDFARGQYALAGLLRAILRPKEGSNA